MAKKTEEEITYETIYNEFMAMDIPLLTLDKGWHDLFYDGKPKEVEKLEKKLNNELKEQGRINSKKEELNSLKQTLLKQIVDNMEAEENTRGSKKVEKSRELIEDINNQLILLEDKQLGTPDAIREANVNLLMEGMDGLCRKSLQNAEEIEELEQLIESARIELKKKILLREQKIEENELIYKYLNRTVGRKMVRRYEKYLKEE